MKRAIAFAVAFGLVLCSLVGCGKTKPAEGAMGKSAETKAKMMAIGKETKAALSKMGAKKGGDRDMRGRKAEAGGQ